MTIKTSRQLKDKIKNLSGGDFAKSQMLLRKYIMERFLARISVSEYKNNFILKGGMLVSAVLGKDARSTMDIDTTIRHLPINLDDAKIIVTKIMKIELDDGILYEIVRIEDIMEEHDYSGVRITLKAHIDGIKETIKIDISTGDEITPFAIQFSYNMMFDQGNISILSYNLETLFAEKLETVLARNTANTRMRDFYDIHILWREKMTK